MHFLLSHFRRLYWPLILPVFFLTGFGLVSIYSSSLRQENFLNFKKQIIFVALSFLIMVAFSLIDWRFFQYNPYFILFLYFLGIISLVGLFFFAPETRGIKGWYKFGIISFDPIEFVEIILVILLAKYFSTRHIEMYKLRHILLSGFYVLLPIALIFFQPDFGSVIVLIFLWIGILFISGIRLKHFLILVLVGILIFSFSWAFLFKSYQKARVIGFLTPKENTLSINWSQIQSKIAIGNGGILGKGFANGSQTQGGFLSEPQTDFIFAAIGEEFGLVGLLAVFFFLAFFFWQVIKIALNSRFNFCRLFASGFAIVIFAQTFIHIGMNLGFLPVIGIPLPFVSYGGSGLIASAIGLGILLNIEKEN